MDLFKVALIGGGAYLLYSYFTQSQPSGNGGGEVGVSQDVVDQIVALAGGTDGLDWDQWNYYLGEVTGKKASMDLAGVVRRNPMPVMSLGTFLGLVAGQDVGLSGLGGLGRVRRVGMMGYANQTNSFERMNKKFLVN